ncbi:YaaL family protein [Paenibacillus sp. MWE-103]|uniref:YaaL family protein n=1 Tax=Paenibacillus artemisiicola TaxID=1172618 RepID=A0ABS3WK58_9BACL|nr:YaaL family protein [Paenibacillus artemisiicola]MBO7748716.1 YaaL family protein [Paenibacillus artemisiicola]
MWKWLKRRRPAKELMQKSERQEHLELLEEIHTARREWENALRFFDYALDSDQIDYAIYAIASAEKRYGMLLRKAKRTPAPWTALKGGVAQ